MAINAKMDGMEASFEVNQLNLVSVAYVGDAVYSLFVRQRLIKRHDFKSGKLHMLSNKYVSAVSQAKILDSIISSLSESEIDVVRRARNTHTPAKAKNAGLSDYKKATALEGLIGYLYLAGQDERLQQILLMCAELVESAL